MGEYVVKMRGVIVGRAALAASDPASGVLTGPFRPGLGWDLVEPIFRLYAEATPGGAAGAAGATDEAKLARFFKARDALGLELHDARGAVMPTRAIMVYDFRREAGRDALELEVIAGAGWDWGGRRG